MIENGYLFEFARDQDPVGLPASKILLNFRVASGLSPGLGYRGVWDRAQEKACAPQAACFEHLPSAAYVSSKEGSDHPQNLIVGRCPCFPELGADTVKWVKVSSTLLLQCGQSGDEALPIRCRYAWTG